MSHLPCVRIITLLTAVVLVTTAMTTVQAQTTWHVDDDGPGDPGPGNPIVSDPLEDGSAQHPFDAIQEGIDASGNGDTVLVADGTYTGDGNRDIDFEGRLITLRSENGPDNCIIDCEDAVRCFYFHNGETADAVVEGLTISNGLAFGGGGMYNRDSNPTLINCTFTGNSADDGGGMFNYYSSPTLINCTFTGNSADDGGGMYNYYSSPTLMNCTLSGNSATQTGGCGGGLFNWYSSPTVTNCTLNANWASWNGGAMGNKFSDPTVANCAFNGNSARGGAGMANEFSAPKVANCTFNGNVASDNGGGLLNWYSSTTVTNCTFTGNSADDGGGMFNYYSSPTVTNCTFSGNLADQGGGGMDNSEGSPMVTNCTFTGNAARSGGGLYSDRVLNSTITACTFSGNAAARGGGLYVDNLPPTIANTIVAFNSSGIYWWGVGTPTLRHNCVYGNDEYDYYHITDPTGTDGNISADPLFAGWEYGNNHIQPDSPCVDAGDNAYAHGDSDIDGQARIQPGGGTVDIGADESDGTVWPTGPYVIVRVSPGGNDGNNGSSWGLAKRTVQAGIDAAAEVGGEVWVQAGTYHERITLHPYAHVYGGFSGSETEREERDWSVHATILDGQQQGSVVTARAGHRVSTIDAFTIMNGSASYGGGVYLPSCSPTIANNTITDNSASWDGGGLYLSGGSPTIANNTIADNSASDDGGGLYLSGGSPTIANNAITGNSAFNSGGGLFVDQSSPTIANNTIADNSASNGGAMFAWCFGLPIMVTDCTFANNTAGSSGGEGLGGAIYCSGSVPLFRNCLFRANTAIETSGLSGWGGAIYFEDSAAFAESCAFVGNSADQAGGAISNTQNSDLTLIDCTFVDNLAHWGGALWSGSSPADVVNCRFVGNEAAAISPLLPLGGYGGAVTTAWEETVLSLTNSLFAGNKARYGAGVDVVASTSATFANCSIVHNMARFAGGGVYNESRIAPVQCHMANCVVWGNAPDEILTLPPSTAYVAYSCVNGGHAGPGNIPIDPQFAGGPSGSWTADAEYDAATSRTTFTDSTAGWAECELVGKTLNPDVAQYRQSLVVANTATTLTVWGNFAALGTSGASYQVHDYHLLPGSPCIDAGSSGAVPPDSADLDGDGDTAERTPLDLDDRPRFVNDPDTEDTGIGDPPDYPEVVDMGAYEFVPFFLDIKPGSCPNPFNRNSHGVLPVAVVGTVDFDVTTIDVSTVRLSRADGAGGQVAPQEGPPGPHSVLNDVATPFDGERCDCHDLEDDGIVDLMMHFKTDAVVPALELNGLLPGELVQLVVTGNLLDGTPFIASDCVRLVPPGTPPGLVVVRSTIPGAWIDAYPLDLQLDGGGFADFERTYPLTSVVSLTAPRMVDGMRFAHWETNGQPQARGQTSVDFEVTGVVMEVTAIYRNPTVEEIQGTPVEQIEMQPIGGAMQPRGR